MHPPAHICQALYRKNPHLRLAWKGCYVETEHEGIKDVGHFALIRLVPLRAVGNREDPLTVKEFWDCTVEMNDVGGFDTVRDEKGPIFNRWGGTSPDWDQLERAPMIAAYLTEVTGWTTYDVFSGKLVKAISIVPLEEEKRRYAQSLVEKGKQMDAMVADTSAASVDRILYDANKTDQTREIVARKHIRQDHGLWEQAAEAKKERKKFEHYYVKKAGMQKWVK